MTRRDDDRSDAGLTDRAWRGYHPRAAVPAVALASAASVALMVGRWLVRDLSELADRAGALVVFAMAAAVWPVLVLGVIYRCVTYTYRLTEKALLVDYGSRHRPVPPVWLRDVTGVTTGRGWVGRWLGIGWVRVATADRAVTLTGVRNPTEFAAEIAAAVRAARTTNDPR